MTDDAVRAVLARQLADALDVIRALLRVLDEQALRIVWSEAARDAYQRGHALVEPHSAP